ncbi:MAG TPA: 50S ribosomal protein L15 [Candidatus Bathyarchaeota archaeon]|nr:50S ribosomal protein L15 [Candidatus Bathyarchaeota archaeon]HEW89787.1 50S ribosomal protein L15 [Candidatus Bathyarchaeota archaeon]
MPHRLRKTRWKRGSRTHGYGAHDRHRGRGSRHYRRAGRHKHLWSYVVKYEPDYFGKRGFKSPRSKFLKMRTINVGQLDELVEALEAKGLLEEREGMAYVDLEALGYAKLLGRGRLTRPVLVRVREFTETAEKKVLEAGGKILTD